MQARPAYETQITTTVATQALQQTTCPQRSAFVFSCNRYYTSVLLESLILSSKSKSGCKRREKLIRFSSANTQTQTQRAASESLHMQHCHASIEQTTVLFSIGILANH